MLIMRMPQSTEWHRFIAFSDLFNFGMNEHPTNAAMAKFIYMQASGVAS
jgi:hypothetical protein